MGSWRIRPFRGRERRSRDRGQRAGLVPYGRNRVVAGVGGKKQAGSRVDRRAYGTEARRDASDRHGDRSVVGHRVGEERSIVLVQRVSYELRRRRTDLGRGLLATA